jgi:hypothetical protein
MLPVLGVPIQRRCGLDSLSTAQMPGDSVGTPVIGEGREKRRTSPPRFPPHPRTQFGKIGSFS